MITESRVDIEELVKTKVPPLSSSAVRVATLVQDLNASTRAIADCISLDPALAARIMRIANSPLYAIEGSVTTLPSAVNVLGNQALHTLIIISAANGSFDRHVLETPVGQRLWEHLIATGVLARELTRMLGMRGADEAMLCGLLHDIGKLVMLQYDYELYRRVAEASTGENVLQLEQELYGYTHAQVGALVAKRWELPEEIAYVILNHHNASEVDKHAYIVRLVDAASELAKATASGEPLEDGSYLATYESVIALQLSVSQLQNASTMAQGKLRAMRGLL